MRKLEGDSLKLIYLNIIKDMSLINLTRDDPNQVLWKLRIRYYTPKSAEIIWLCYYCNSVYSNHEINELP